MAIVAVSVSYGGCGGESRVPRAASPRGVADAAPPIDAQAAASGDASSDARAALSVDEVAERAGSIAPGMREAVRADGDAPLERDVVRNAEKDTCARAAFSADGAVRAALVSGAGDVLADVPPSTSGVVGTACARRGDAIVLRFEPGADGGATRVHAVAWVSP